VKLIFLAISSAMSLLGLSRREDEGSYNTHRPHRTLNQAAPLRPLPDDVTDLDHIRVRRCDRVGGMIHEYRLVA
jgi:putative transposase